MRLNVSMYITSRFLLCLKDAGIGKGLGGTEVEADLGATMTAKGECHSDNIKLR